MVPSCSENMAHPTGLSQTLLPRPLPVVCRSARATSPSMNGDFLGKRSNVDDTVPA